MRRTGRSRRVGRAQRGAPNRAGGPRCARPTLHQSRRRNKPGLSHRGQTPKTRASERSILFGDPDMKRILLALVLVGSLFSVPTPTQEKNPVVVLDTSLGKISIELFPGQAPDTVKNFLKYADEKFYDG